MQVTEILQVIKPYVLGWVESSGEEGGYAPSPHELDGAHHIGTLTTSQYPDALLRDGSRSLTGNLSVGAGITVDGVDISAFKSDYDSHILTANAHHNQVSLNANADAILSLSVQQIGLDTQIANRVFAGPTSGGAAVPTFRALVAADIPALGGTPALTFTTSNAAGSASTYVRTDASLAIFDATVPTTIQPDDAAAAGSAAFAARRDHKHAIVAAAPGNQAIGDSATEGTATSFARSDHKHGMPSFATPSVSLGAAAAAGSAATLLRSDCTIVAFDATVPTTIQPDDAAATGSAAVAARRDHKHAIVAAAPGNQAVGDSATEGTATSFARSDHKHGMPSFATPSVSLGTAAAAGSAVTLLRSDCTIVAFDATAPTTIQPDDAAATGSAAYAARRDHKHAIAAAAPGANSVSLAASAEGTATSFARSDHSHNLSQAIVPTWTGLHTFNAGIDLAGTLEFQGAQSITSTSGDLTIAPAGDLKLNPTGAQIRVMASHTLQSDNYASQTTGWGISYAGGADFRYLFADEMHVKSFIADLEQALAGGQIIAKSVAMVSRDFTAPAAGGTATLYVWDLPSAEGMAAFESGDIVRLRTFSRAAGSLTVADCWGVVTSYSDLANKEQSWTFTRSSGGNEGSMAASTVVSADSLALDYGTTGDGFYEVNAIDGAYGANSPYSQIVTWATHPATGQTVRTRLGNLYGITATTEYGLFAGEGVTAGDSYLRLTDQNFELHNLDLAMYDSGNVQRIGMDAGAGSTDKLMWAGVSSSDPGFVVYGDGTVWLSTLAISEQMGDMLFTQADGLLLLGPGCPITTTSWTTLRGQIATISGAFHQVAGPWAESRALVIEPAATNLIPNPRPDPAGSTSGYEIWYSSGTGTLSNISDTTFPGVGSRCIEGRFVGTPAEYLWYRTISVTTGETYVFSFFIKSTENRTWYVQIQEHGGSYASWSTAVPISVTTEWQRFSIPLTSTGTGSARFRWSNNSVATDLYLYVGNIQVEHSLYGTTYIDGGLGTDYAWTSTAHASSSTRAATTLAINPTGVIDLSSGSISIWFQMPCDAGTSGLPTTRGLFEWWNAWNTESFYLPFTSTMDSIGVASYAGSSQQVAMYASLSGSKAGDWHHVVVTAETNSVKLYLDGVLAGTDTSYTPPAITATTAYLGYVTAHFGGALGQFASFGRVLTAEEVATLHAQGRPLADAGALRRPGLYILDGEIDVRTAQTGARVQLDGDGIAAYSDATTQTIAIDTDGDFRAGSDISAAGTTAFAVFATAQTYNSEAVGAGDVLLGDNSSGKANALWDASDGILRFRGGTTTQAYISTTGKVVFGGGDGWLDGSGLSFDVASSATSNAEAVKWYESSDEIGRIVCYKSSSTYNFMYLWAKDPDGDTISKVDLLAGDSSNRAEVYVQCNQLTEAAETKKAGMIIDISGPEFYIYEENESGVGVTASQRAVFHDLSVRVERGIYVGAISANAPYGYAQLTGGISLNEVSSTPTHTLTESAQVDIYLKGDKLVFRFNDAGTTRYKYLDLSSTGVTWVHTTSAP